MVNEIMRLSCKLEMTSSRCDSFDKGALHSIFTEAVSYIDMFRVSLTVSKSAFTNLRTLWCYKNAYFLLTHLLYFLYFGWERPIATHFRGDFRVMHHEIPKLYSCHTERGLPFIRPPILNYRSRQSVNGYVLYSCLTVEV